MVRIHSPRPFISLESLNVVTAEGLALSAVSLSLCPILCPPLAFSIAALKAKTSKYVLAQQARRFSISTNISTLVLLRSVEPEANRLDG